MWRKRQAWLLAHPAQIGNIVFIDETGINTKMARLRGRCLKGRRMVAGIPHGHWKTMTFIAGLRCDGLTAPWVIEGAMDGDAFEQYVKTQLAPTLEKGDVVIADNLSAHKRDAAKQAIERRGAWLLFPQNLWRLCFRVYIPEHKGLTGCDSQRFHSLIEDVEIFLVYKQLPPFSAGCFPHNTQLDQMFYGFQYRRR